jgi:hypothetical protein
VDRRLEEDGQGAVERLRWTRVQFLL